MLIIKPRKNESIEMMLKRYKRKFDKVKILKQLRDNQQFDKPSVKKRQKKQKAVYVEQMKKDDL